jgi:U32 family peptidase
LPPGIHLRRFWRGAQDTPLNLKDNSLVSHAADLYKAGVDSLKIEGRIKGYEYVYSTVSAWREQLDRLYAEQAPGKTDPRLAAVFNRSFSDNMIRGRLCSDSFTPDSDDKSSELLGIVAGYNAALRELSISVDAQLSAGQCITIKNENGGFICTGTLIERINSCAYRFRIEHKLMGKILRGQQIWGQPKVVDFSAVKEQLSSITAREEKIPLHFRLKGESGGPLILHAGSRDKHVTVSSASQLEKASENPTAQEAITRQLSRLGNTPFYIASCDLSGLAKGLFIPVKVLNNLRRKAVAELEPEKHSMPMSVSVPTLEKAEPPRTRRIAVAVADREQLQQLPRDASVLALFQLSADPEVLDRVAPLFTDYTGMIPWFPSILIGSQYTAACDFLLNSGVQQIVTDNSGIACFAGEHGIAWIAGPLLNGTNGYALDFFREYGACGAFCSSELNFLQCKNITVPKGIELWSPLAAPDFLMKSRHCIVRNCSDCGKFVMDDQCLPSCSRWGEITDSQGNEILVIKNRGDFNSLYRKGLRFYSDRLKDTRIGTWVLDLRVSHESMLPDCSIPEFIEYTRELIGRPEPEQKYFGGKPKNLSKEGCL